MGLDYYAFWHMHVQICVLQIDTTRKGAIKLIPSSTSNYQIAFTALLVVRARPRSAIE